MDDAQSRPPSLLALPSYLASHVARIGHLLLVDALAEHDLRLPHFAVLTGLSDFGPLAQHDLADRLGLNRSHLVGYLDTVEERGLIRRERDPDDRRRQRVALTAAGVELQQRLQQLAQDSQRKFLDVLTESERSTLMELLGRVLRANGG
ncbi:MULTISPECIES: MarR family winged helix-turn-helix transcriptional regulator [unclassified Streptomyces]|uniref:MarR family winged helix-turn-helix transcriptional regulator n=1 Tax=unclassified Streptomyces TaxID=2593676 RepID=UPI0033AD63E6